MSYNQISHPSQPQLKRGSASGIRWARLVPGQFTWVWVATALLFVVSAFVAPGTVRIGAIVTMLPFAALLAVVAVGQTIIIQQRGLDMSCGSQLSLGGVIFCQAHMSTSSIAAAFVLAVLSGIVGGTLNGLLVFRFRITPIVATLATNSIFAGVMLTLTGGSSATAPTSLQNFLTLNLFGMPYLPLIAIAVLVVAFVAFAIDRTVTGRRFIATGANEAAALSAGINIGFYKVATYSVAGVCFALAGVLYAGFIGTITPYAGNDYLLPGIAAVVVGGTNFSGGKGSVVASAVAALFMTQLGQMVLAMGASTAVQLLVQALAIVVAVGIRNIEFGAGQRAGQGR